MIKNILTAKDSKEIITKIKFKSLQNLKTYIVNHFFKLLNNFSKFKIEQSLFITQFINVNFFTFF